MKKKVTRARARETIKVPTDQLKLGMHVSRLDRPWLDTPFLFQGFPVHDQDDLTALKNICEFVYIDVLKTGVAPEVRSPFLGRGAPKQYSITTEVEKEIRLANEFYHKSFDEVERILDTAYKGDRIETAEIRRHIKEPRAGPTAPCPASASLPPRPARQRARPSVVPDRWVSGAWQQARR